MEILQSFEFKKPSRSRYATVVKALVDDGAAAVRLKRGVDFPAEVSMDGVQSAVADQVRKRGKRARTFRESDDELVVALWADGQGPALAARRQRKQGRRQPVPA
jgi:hypothetical protein